MVPVAVGYDGKKLNSPNDLVFDSQGALYFTDPPFGLPGTFTDPTKELTFNGVFRVAPDGKISAVATELEAPNGLGFSPDYKTLYVANARASSPIWKAYAVHADGSLDKGRVFADSAALYKEGDGVPDGLKVDVQGNVFATGPGGVLVYAPDGTLLGRILTGVPTSNVAFGEDGSTLFITANHRVLRMRTMTHGVPLPARPMSVNEGDSMTSRRPLIGLLDRCAWSAVYSGGRHRRRQGRACWCIRAAPAFATIRFPPRSRR